MYIHLYIGCTYGIHPWACIYLRSPMDSYHHSAPNITNSRVIMELMCSILGMSAKCKCCSFDAKCLYRRSINSAALGYRKTQRGANCSPLRISDAWLKPDLLQGLTQRPHADDRPRQCIHSHLFKHY